MIKTETFFLYLSSFYIFISAIFLINMLQLPYHSLFFNTQQMTIQLNLMPPSYQQITIQILSLTMIVFSGITAKNWGKKSKSLFIFATLVALTSLIIYKINLNVTSQLLTVLAGFLGFLLTVENLHKKGSLHHIRFLKNQASILILTWIIIELSALTVWLSTPLDPNVQHSWLWQIVQFESQTFHILEFLITPLLLATLFSWLLLPLKKHINKIKILKVRLHNSGGSKTLAYKIKKEGRSKIEKSKVNEKVLLISALIIVVTATYYPYAVASISQKQYIGSDVPWYTSWLKTMDMQSDWKGILSYTFQAWPSRPISLIFTYEIWQISKLPPLETVKFMPLTLGPLFILSVYFFTEKTENHNGGLAALFASFSYTVTLGVICAFYSNWFALSILYIFSLFLLKSMKTPSKKLIFLTLTSSAILLFSHSFTWVMYTGIIAVYLIISIPKSIKTRKLTNETKILSLTLIFNLIADILKENLISKAGGSITQTANIAQTRFSIQHLLNFYTLTQKDLTQAMLGSLINPPILILALIGALTIILGENTHLNRYLTATLIASSLAFIPGEWALHIRILYNIPIFLFASIATEKTILNPKNKEFPQKTKFLPMILLILLNMNYLLRCSFIITRHIRSI